MIDVCLLGTSGMMPLPNRWLSALLIRCGQDVVLCDCGEGTQISWQHTEWGFRDVSTITLSHLHADHVAGLPGVLYMIAHAGRTETLTIYGPTGTINAVRALRVIVPRLPYEVEIRELNGGETHDISEGFTLSALAVEHPLPCLAYRFDRARAPRFMVEKARALDLPVELWSQLQAGETVEHKGRTYPASLVTGPPREGIRLAFITDTRPTAELPDFVRGADLIVCEGMYGDPSLVDRAIERGHMTFAEAAGIARDASAKALWLTHFSPSVEHPEDFLSVAREIFADTQIGEVHQTKTLSFEDDEPESS